MWVVNSETHYGPGEERLSGLGHEGRMLDVGCWLEDAHREVVRHTTGDARKSCRDLVMKGGCWMLVGGCASRGSETHYGRCEERLSGFGHDFIVICRLEAPDRRLSGRPSA